MLLLLLSNRFAALLAVIVLLIGQLDPIQLHLIPIVGVPRCRARVSAEVARVDDARSVAGLGVAPTAALERVAAVAPRSRQLGFPPAE